MGKRKVGDIIKVDGFYGKLKYLGYGQFSKRQEILPIKRHIGLIAAGSGITKLLAIAQASVLAQDGLKISLLYCNKTKNDIMCKSTLDSLNMRSRDINIHYTLTRHEREAHGPWSGLLGRPSLKMLQEIGFPEPAEDVLVVICGPKPFNNDLWEAFKAAGWDKNYVNLCEGT